MNTANQPKSPALVPAAPAGAEIIDLAAGCFWCTEAVFQQIPGVISVTSGYMGGATVDPTYEQICDGNTGHAEITRIVFDPGKVSLEHILETFWKMHDPTTPNRQGNDVGTQYRSAIFFADDRQRTIAELSKQTASKNFRVPIVTEIVPDGNLLPGGELSPGLLQLKQVAQLLLRVCHHAQTRQAGPAILRFLARSFRGTACAMRITYYLEVLSSWCYWAEPAWAELRKTGSTARSQFEWKDRV